MIRRILLILLLTFLLGPGARAWVYPEHREITRSAILKLDSARRSLLDQLWSQARKGFESRTAVSVIDDQPQLHYQYLDYAAWPAIGGDHSVSAQDMLNNILPLFDPMVAKYCILKMHGLDADSPEREATRLGEDQNIHMTYNQILERFEKDPLPKSMGGDFPLNPAFQTVVKNYRTFGEIQEYFFGVEGASKDPSKAFYENPMWFQYQQMLMQRQQL